MKKQLSLDLELPQTHLGKLADKYVRQNAEIQEAKGVLDGIRESIMVELEREKRKALTIEDNGLIFYFEIVATGKKLKVSKTKMAVGARASKK